jgi:hypothetical protein
MIRGLAALLIAGLCALPAQADSLHPGLDRKVTVTLGASDFDVDARVASWEEGEDKQVIDLGRIGVPEDDSSVWAGIHWKVSDRWRLAASYFSIDVDGGSRVDFDFEFGDLVVPVGASVDASLSLDFYVLTVGYSFFRSERAELGLGLGVHGVDLDFDIYAERRIGDNVTVLGQESEDFLAPLPNAYLYGSYAFSPKILAQLSGGWVSLTYDEYDGELLSLNGQLAYWPNESFSIGLGYSFIDIDVDRDRGTKREYYDLDLDGPRAFVSVAF